MTGSSTMCVDFKRGNGLLRHFYSTHWKVALELLLRTDQLISERRRVSDIIF